MNGLYNRYNLKLKKLIPNYGKLNEELSKEKIIVYICLFEDNSNIFNYFSNFPTKGNKVIFGVLNG